MSMLRSGLQMSNKVERVVGISIFITILLIFVVIVWHSRNKESSNDDKNNRVTVKGNPHRIFIAIAILIGILIVLHLVQRFAKVSTRNMRKLDALGGLYSGVQQVNRAFA